MGRTEQSRQGPMPEQKGQTNPYASLLHEALNDAFSELSHQESTIIRLNFGLVPKRTPKIDFGDPQNVPLPTIATNLGLNIREASHIRAQGLEKIKDNKRISALAFLQKHDESFQKAYADEQFQPAVNLLRYVHQANGEPTIGSGVKPETFNFLQVTKVSGALEKLDKDWQEIIDRYFTTNTRLEDIAKEFDQGSLRTLRKRFYNNLNEMWNNLPAGLQEVLPRDDVVSLKTQNHRIHSPETKAKISTSQKGKIIPTEVREKQRIAHLGKTHTPETRAKMSESRIGKKKSPETKARMSAARKRQIAEKKERTQKSSETQIFPSPEAA